MSTILPWRVAQQPNRRFPFFVYIQRRVSATKIEAFNVEGATARETTRLTKEAIKHRGWNRD